MPVPVAQLDRAPDFESVGCEFESRRAHQLSPKASAGRPDFLRELTFYFSVIMAKAVRSVALCEGGLIKIFYSVEALNFDWHASFLK